MHSALPEIGFYALAGGATNPRDLIDEVAAAEALGLGSAFISERLNLKEAATISGAIGSLSDSIGIATAATNYNVRNPLVTAAHASTMQALTGGRYTLGIGRGISYSLNGMGLRQATTPQLEAFAHLIRDIISGDRPSKRSGRISVPSDPTSSELPHTSAHDGVRPEITAPRSSCV